MAEAKNFGSKLAELEAIAAWFESDNVDLNEALAKFERGMTLASELKGELQTIENRVEKIKQRFDVAVAPTEEAEATAEPTEPPAQDGPNLFS